LCKVVVFLNGLASQGFQVYYFDVILSTLTGKSHTSFALLRRQCPISSEDRSRSILKR